MDMSKECRMNDGPRGCWTGSQIGEGKEEDQEEPGDRIYKQRWNGEICIVEIGKIENYGMQDAENGDSCKKPALYIYIYVCMNACMYVLCMHVCVYVRIMYYVCLYLCIYICM